MRTPSCKGSLKKPPHPIAQVRGRRRYRTGPLQEVLVALRAAPRIAFIRMADGLTALNTTVELMRDLGRPRGTVTDGAASIAMTDDVLGMRREFLPDPVPVMPA